MSEICGGRSDFDRIQTPLNVLGQYAKSLNPFLQSVGLGITCGVRAICKKPRHVGES